MTPALLSWPYDHPPKGTCHVGCERHGLCHCGCSGEPKICHRTSEARHHTMGEPFVFIAGHNPRTVVGAWNRNGADIEKVRPLLQWLIDRYGVRGTAELTGIPKGTVNSLAYQPNRSRCNPDSAARITEAVLKHRPAKRDPWATFDTETRRPPTQWESERAEKYAEAEYQRLRGARKYLADVHALDEHTRAAIDRRIYRKRAQEAS